jgi:U3 small nucleolar RNA-associated protein 25
MFVCRSEAIKNDQKIKKTAKAAPNPKSAKKPAGRMSRATAVEESEYDPRSGGDGEDVSSYQDSGYTRPRVLVLTPFRSSAMSIINGMVELLDGGSGGTVVTGSDKLAVEYGMTEQEEDDVRAENRNKPEDWLDKFRGNVDDDFKMGIQINPGQGKSTGTDAGKAPLVRLYSDFLVSDVIVASPLGLRLALEKGDGGEDKAAADFLSSIEIVLISQADVMLMQNWDHMEFVLRMCNRLPRADHDTDFSRIRPYFLDGRAAEHRQMIMLSPFQDPSLQAVMRECAKSRAGSVRARRDRAEGCLSSVVSRVKQIFSVVPVTSLASEDDDRFQYFCDSVLTKLLRLKQSHTLIVTPSYLSYVRVRNELIKRDANAAFVCEYSRESEISRGRSQFFHGIRDIMLYSGRAHFFRRFRMRGALHLIFYSLPEYAQFYPEIVNNLGEGGAHGTVTSCLVLCTKYEKLALERIVGAKRCAHMLTSGKTTFMFI